jgi:hypothetical protein
MTGIDLAAPAHGGVVKSGTPKVEAAKRISRRIMPERNDEGPTLEQAYWGRAL